MYFIFREMSSVSLFIGTLNGELLIFVLNVFIHQETNKLCFNKNEWAILLFIVL